MWLSVRPRAEMISPNLDMLCVSDTVGAFSLDSRAGLKLLRLFTTTLQKSKRFSILLDLRRRNF